MQLGLSLESSSEKVLSLCHFPQQSQTSQREKQPSKPPSMSDEEHHFESKADAGASKTYPQQAGTIRKNGYIVIKGRPCKVFPLLLISASICILLFSLKDLSFSIPSMLFVCFSFRFGVGLCLQFQISMYFPDSGLLCVCVCFFACYC